MSDFGGNNEADSKLRQHCIALEAENERLTAENATALSIRNIAWKERDALATRCGDAERDYADMRKFQAKFIEADTRCRELEAMLRFARAYIAPTASPSGSVIERIDEALDAAIKGGKPSTPK